MATDSIPSGLSHTPSSQLVCDSVIPVGYVYPNKHKSDAKGLLLEHFQKFCCPLVVKGDFAKEIHEGKNKIMCRGKCVQLRSPAPHDQWLNPAGRYQYRLFNIATSIALDS